MRACPIEDGRAVDTDLVEVSNLFPQSMPPSNQFRRSGASCWKISKLSHKVFWDFCHRWCWSAGTLRPRRKQRAFADALKDGLSIRVAQERHDFFNSQQCSLSPVGVGALKPIRQDPIFRVVGFIQLQTTLGLSMLDAQERQQGFAERCCLAVTDFISPQWFSIGRLCLDELWRSTSKRFVQKLWTCLRDLLQDYTRRVDGIAGAISFLAHSVSRFPNRDAAIAIDNASEVGQRNRVIVI